MPARQSTFPLRIAALILSTLFVADAHKTYKNEVGTWKTLSISKNDVRFWANRDCNANDEETGTHWAETGQNLDEFTIIPGGNKNYGYQSFQVGTKDNDSPVAVFLRDDTSCAFYKITEGPVDTMAPLLNHTIWLEWSQQSVFFLDNVNALKGDGRYKDGKGVGYCFNFNETDASPEQFDLLNGSYFICATQPAHYVATIPLPQRGAGILPSQ